MMNFLLGLACGIALTVIVSKANKALFDDPLPEPAPAPVATSTPQPKGDWMYDRSRRGNPLDQGNR